MDEPEVTFEPKSAWQKSDCINRHADYQCPNPSTLEAVCGTTRTTRVRCCTDERCKAWAAELARASAL